MTLSPLAGKPAPKELLIDPARLEREYYARKPEPIDPAQLVSFGTSGHRGSPLRGSFNEAHIVAITQAICDYRRAQRHQWAALHGPRHACGVRAGAAHGAGGTRRQRSRDGHPERRWIHADPAISRAILVHNRDRTDRLADGIVITPSHNPPEDGGFKYNPPNGGPADADVTGWIQTRANALLREGNRGAKRLTLACGSACCDVPRAGLRRPVRGGPAPGHRHGCDPRRATEARGRPPRRRRRALLGADQSRLRPRHRSSQSAASTRRSRS